ncbi:hypothetical protein NPIL_521481 [Nephila pilipes]|uniref:Uncharacterized protein n=1 Tax=Nephila pilipes TaxID=299642 RepID=A0A8X6PGX4_NEPPI|nr:hypothetical protein NPIL_521481 [Nephila pilipes]
MTDHFVYPDLPSQLPRLVKDDTDNEVFREHNTDTEEDAELDHDDSKDDDNSKDFVGKGEFEYLKSISYNLNHSITQIFCLRT